MDRNLLSQQFVRNTLTVICLVTSAAALGPAQAMAAGLGDYLWERRPLLLFAPAERDPRLVETMDRIEDSRCDFADRDMVLGRIVTEGTSTLDGHVVDNDQARWLVSEFGIGTDSFSVVLLGKDGGEKLRVADVPDLQAICVVIDGMPMRARETSANPSRC